MIRIIILFLFSVYIRAGTIDFDNIFKIISIIESNENPYAIGDNGRAIGIVQIHKICIDDVNNHFNTDYRHYDAFNVDKSRDIFELYLTMGIIFYKYSNNRFPTIEHIVKMWNGGIYNGYRIHSTEKYYKKFIYISFKLLQEEQINNINISVTQLWEERQQDINTLVKPKIEVKKQFLLARF